MSPLGHDTEVGLIYTLYKNVILRYFMKCLNVLIYFPTMFFFIYMLNVLFFFLFGFCIFRCVFLLKYWMFGVELIIQWHVVFHFLDPDWCLVCSGLKKYCKIMFYFRLLIRKDNDGNKVVITDSSIESVVLSFILYFVQHQMKDHINSFIYTRGVKHATSI